MHVSDPNGVNLRTESDPRHGGAATGSRPSSSAGWKARRRNLISPHEWSLSSTSVANAYGFTSLPHLRNLAIRGPLDPVGVSDTPSRRRIFSCRPDAAGDAPTCARGIVTRLGTGRLSPAPSPPATLRPLMALYDTGAAEAGFEAGVRMALEGILASPHFVFRFEAPPAGADPTGGFTVSDHALASRLSFFLWASGPDAELIDLATAGRLSAPAVLDAPGAAHARRPAVGGPGHPVRGAVAAACPDLDAMHPDVRTHPRFRRAASSAPCGSGERSCSFTTLVRGDRSLLELLTADYSFVNERLARHYRLPGVAGDHHRRVAWPAGHRRRGLLGHGSVLTLTSHADRTSPVLRGKWVMEVLLGSPPPPPPPDVPDLDDTRGRRRRPAAVGAGTPGAPPAEPPACSSCHRMMDPDRARPWNTTA